MKKILGLIMCFACLSMQAKVTLPSFISDNMVLQQQTKANLWGTAAAGKQVRVTTSWNNKTVTTTAATNGSWKVAVATPKAGGPYTITVSDGTPVTLKNVLIGEVWFCSGQSNMEMPMKGFGRQPVEGATETILRAQASRPIRICQVTRCSSVKVEPIHDTWKENTPGVVAETSAIAYYFADALEAALNVPVGLIITDWGGSSIETWISREVIERDFGKEFNLDYLNDPEKAKQKANQYPCLLFNGQVASLIPYTFKGMIWYQGETNRGREEQYTRLQTSYVKMMRELFQCPDAPFYFVQIAPYIYDAPNKWTSGYFYEGQANSLKTIPHSGMATTVDAGELKVIHPQKKQIVSRRLADLALKHDYGMDFIEADAPLYKSMTVKDHEIQIEFDNAPRGLAPLNVELPGFEIAGADKVFHPATAFVTNEGVRVYSDAVQTPVAVRYCFRNWGVGILRNNYGVPAAPFRTDDWKL